MIDTHSSTGTFVNDDAYSIHSANAEAERELYPSPDEQKKHPYLVEFGPDDPENPKVCSVDPQRSLTWPILKCTFDLLKFRIGPAYTGGT